MELLESAEAGAEVGRLQGAAGSPNRAQRSRRAEGVSRRRVLDTWERYEAGRARRAAPQV